jgi:hypothetical protein
LECWRSKTFDYAGVAQLVEQLIRNQQVGGSNPPVGSTFLRVFARSYLKIRIFIRYQDEAEDQPASILKYVEDLRRGLNADIGRKDFFEIASMYSGNFFASCRQQKVFLKMGITQFIS